MARVTASLYATLRQHVDGRPTVEVSIEPGQTVEQLLGQLGVPIDQTRIIFCNNCPVELSHALQGGEMVAVFPAVGGG